MTADSTILKELVTAKDCIKRKYIALKTDEANVQKLITDTWKPIIELLNKISSANQLHSSHNKTLQNNENNNKLKNKTEISLSDIYIDSKEEVGNNIMLDKLF